jgi:hypothetical protein
MTRGRPVCVKLTRVGKEARGRRLFARLERVDAEKELVVAASHAAVAG